MDITESAEIGSKEYEDWKRITELEAKVEALTEAGQYLNEKARKWWSMAQEAEAKVEALEEDLRIANENLEETEKWQDKMTEVYPVVAERITELLAPPKQEVSDE